MSELDLNKAYAEMVAFGLTAATMKDRPMSEFHDQLRTLIGTHGHMIERIRELEALTQWQPIETAPRDVEVLVCFVSDYGWQEKPYIYGPVTAKFNGKKWVSSWDDERVICSETWAGTEYKDVEFEPTHWMPLPKPPEEKSDD